MSVTVVILAAGEGKRMRSSLPKVLHPLCGKPLVHDVVETAKRLKPDAILAVVGSRKEAVLQALPEGVEAVDQGLPRGTGHAMMRVAEEHPRLGGTVVVLSGDVPLVTAGTLRAMLAHHRRRRAALTLATAVLEHPDAYGRIVRDASGAFLGIREASDAPREILRIPEVNAGIYVMDWGRLRPLLATLRPANRQREYYLTDLASRALGGGMRVEPYILRDPREMLGVNTRNDLANLHRILYAVRASELMERGVTVLDPASTFVDPGCSVGRDTILYPNVHLRGARIGRGCVIYPGNIVEDSTVGAGTILNPNNWIEGARIGKACRVGPMSHLRPGTVLGDGVRVGNFVETKKARLGRGTKAAHLTYLGDAEIGRGANIGCGTITCNYDGRQKHVTVIGDGAFIGSDCQLVAPVKVGRGAYTASGTTVTEDVPPGALAVGRARQRNIPGWVKRKRGQ
jgi:bifunctional UDP-N-acetylglucosamine pyrophosphorylase/glucosamine-1-phosphate N-acetyltransferase